MHNVMHNEQEITMTDNTLHLLIIESSDDDAGLLLRHLQKGGYSLAWERVDSAKEMLAAVARQEWDLIIADYAMPSFNGLEAIRLLKKVGVDTPCIMVSDESGDQAAVEAIKAGAHDYLLKDQLSLLSSTVERELAGVEDRRQWRDSERELVLLRQAMETISLGVTITDIKNRILYTNPAEARMHGYEVSELIGADARMLAPKECWNQEGYDPEHRGLSIRESLNIHKDGTVFPVRITSSIVLDSRGEPFGMTTIREDIGERRKVEEKLRHMSTHDPLTGLHNRAFLEDELKRLDRSQRFPISVIMVDVDGLKKTNHRGGHAAGDCVLQEAARVLADMFGPEDLVARMGGDEFIIVLPETDSQAAVRTVERIRTRLRDEHAQEGAIKVSMSLGAATSVEPDTLADTVKLADARMYLDKASRRYPAIYDRAGSRHGVITS